MRSRDDAFAYAEVSSTDPGYNPRVTSRYPLADIAALIGEPSRAAMLLALFDGGFLSASALAHEARLSAPAASLHLGKLAQAGLLRVRREGRHRYYELANADVAHALEALSVIASKAQDRARQPDPLRVARTCYDHLACELAIALLAMLERQGHVQARARNFDITAEGEQFFARTFDADVKDLSKGRRPLTRACLDLTERKDHMAGALGAALLRHMMQRRWFARRRDCRALRVTPLGEVALARLGVQVRSEW